MWMTSRNGTMYALDVKPSVDKAFRKLTRSQLVVVEKKLLRIREKPTGYKWLRNPLHSFNRVHIGDFVLILSVDHVEEVVTAFHYAHHDTVYLWRP